MFYFQVSESFELPSVKYKDNAYKMSFIYQNPAKIQLSFG